MKVGDLVTLRWGEHPRKVGTIIKLGPDSFARGTTPGAERSYGLGQETLVGFRRQIWRR